MLTMARYGSLPYDARSPSHLKAANHISLHFDMFYRFSRLIQCALQLHLALCILLRSVSSLTTQFICSLRVREVAATLIFLLFCHVLCHHPRTLQLSLRLKLSGYA